MTNFELLASAADIAYASGTEAACAFVASEVKKIPSGPNGRWEDNYIEMWQRILNLGQDAPKLYDVKLENGRRGWASSQQLGYIVPAESEYYADWFMPIYDPRVIDFRYRSLKIDGRQHATIRYATCWHGDRWYNGNRGCEEYRHWVAGLQSIINAQGIHLRMAEDTPHSPQAALAGIKYMQKKGLHSGIR